VIATPSIESLSVEIKETIIVRASIETTFESLITQLGRQNELPDGTPFPMVIEPWPGGRWYRDLGSNNGHLWGHVQSIKRPTLFEVYGPLFMSYPVASNMMYRLKEVDGGTEIAFRHSAFGLIPEETRSRMGEGWKYGLSRIRALAERAS
jgi:Activator of Hsp90 ATPase homolog 1-like protein